MECKIVIIIALSLILVTSSQAQNIVIGRGDCPDPGSMSEFDLSEYLGTWYEYQRFGDWFEMGMVCVRARYGDDGNGTLSVVNDGYREIKIIGRTVYRIPAYIDGTATVPDSTKPAELKVTFFPADTSTESNYNIVDTDYDGYAVVYSCSKLPNVPLNIQYAWILTRERGKAPDNLSEIYAKLEAAGINTRDFRITDQLNCS